MANNVEIGTYTGNGAAINIELGFIPDHVRVINVTDGNQIFDWFNGMTAGHAIRQQNVVDNGTTGNSSLASITSNGITALAGDRTTPRRPGFTVGTALSTDTKVYRYIASRSTND